MMEQRKAYLEFYLFLSFPLLGQFTKINMSDIISTAKSENVVQITRLLLDACLVSGMNHPFQFVGWQRVCFTQAAGKSYWSSQ